MDGFLEFLGFSKYISGGLWSGFEETWKFDNPTAFFLHVVLPVIVIIAGFKIYKKHMAKMQELIDAKKEKQAEKPEEKEEA